MVIKNDQWFAHSWKLEHGRDTYFVSRCAVTGKFEAARVYGETGPYECDPIGTTYETLEAAQAACASRIAMLDAGQVACSRGDEQLEACRPFTVEACGE